MAIYQFLVYIIPENNSWRNINLDVQALSSELDEIISRSSWTNTLSWKSENENFDHDVNIDYINEHGFIEEFQFRTDLTDNSGKFLNSMLKLCAKNNWILQDNEGNICKPNLKELVQLTKDSDPHRFLKNPFEFLGNLK